MKTDQELKADVAAELAWDAAVSDARKVGIAVKDGIVTLSGTLDNYMEKQAVERAARKVAGVRGIALDLEVKLAPDHQRSDTEIAEAAVYTLRWHVAVPDDRVRVEVEDGWVKLSGEVDWAFQSHHAEQWISHLTGVRGVTNTITIRQRVDPDHIKVQVAAALARHARREARHLEIEVDGSVVTLRGTVDSPAEREAAIGTATGTRGVTRVVDHLKVGEQG